MEDFQWNDTTKTVISLVKFGEYRARIALSDTEYDQYEWTVTGPMPEVGPGYGLVCSGNSYVLQHARRRCELIMRALVESE